MYVKLPLRKPGFSTVYQISIIEYKKSIVYIGFLGLAHFCIVRCYNVMFPSGMSVFYKASYVSKSCVNIPFSCQISITTYTQFTSRIPRIPSRVRRYLYINQSILTKTHYPSVTHHESTKQH